MKINIVWESRNRGGGGFSFADALSKGLQKRDIEITNWEDADIVLIPGASVVTKELVREIYKAGKKIVLRIDNILKSSRNKGSGMTRMFEFSQKASEVVYQCRWARSYLAPFTKREGKIIYNGVDTEVFNTEGDKESFGGRPVYMYNCFSKGETKRWEWAWYRYQMIQRENPKAILVIVGNIPTEVKQWDFNFFMDERYKYLGIISPEDRSYMAKVMRGCDYLMAVYENDAYAQTFCEMLCCHNDPACLHEPNMTGGTPEIFENYHKHGIEFFSNERMTEDYIRLFKDLL